MKKLFIFASLLFTFFGDIVGQNVPQKMSFQSIIRDNSGNLIKNSVVGTRISVIQGSLFGSSIFVETFTEKTNYNGLLTLNIGTGNPINGKILDIPWEKGPFFLKAEYDVLGGSNYTISTTSELLSVPFSFISRKSDTALIAKNIDCIGCISLNQLNSTEIKKLVKDTSNYNELQVISISHDTLFLSNGGFAKLPKDLDKDSMNEIQKIGKFKDSLYLSRGGFIKLNDDDSKNEIQTLKKVRDTISLSNGGFVKLNDDDNTNEIQQIKKTKDTIVLSNGGMIKLIDDDTLNEIQQFKISNDTLRLTKTKQFVLLGNKQQDTLNGNITDLGHGTFSGTYNTNPSTVFNSFSNVWDLSCQIDLGSNTYILGIENYTPQSVLNFNNSTNSITKLRTINSSLKNSYPNIYETMYADKTDTSFTWFNSTNFTIYKAKTDTYLTYPVSSTVNSGFFSLLTMSTTPASYQYQVIKIAKRSDTLVILFQKADKYDFGFYIYKYIGKSDKLIPFDSFEFNTFDGAKAIVNSNVRFQFNSIDYLFANGDFKPTTYSNKIMLGIGILKNLRNKQTNILNIGQAYSSTITVPFQNKFIVWDGGVRNIIDAKTGVSKNFTLGNNTMPDNSRNTLLDKVGGAKNLGNLIINNGKFGLFGSLGSYGSGSLYYGQLYYFNIK